MEIQLNQISFFLGSKEQTHILTDNSDEYHIACTVHGNPSPIVVWRKDGHPVEEDSEGMVITRSGSRHVLIIQNKLCFTLAPVLPRWGREDSTHIHQQF